MSPLPRVNEYAPVEGRVSKPEAVVAGGPAVVSLTEKREPAGIEALPVMLTVPESASVVIEGAVKLSVLATMCDPRFELKAEDENVVGGTTDNALWESCTLKLPAGRLTV